MNKIVLHILSFIAFGISLQSICFAQTFTNNASFYNIETNLNSTDNYGASVSFYDFNQDGLDDLTFANENDSILFYLNNGNGFDRIGSFAYGDGKVKQVSWVDIDNDEDFDLFITVYDGTSKLLINDGNFNFTDVSTAAGLPTSFTRNYGVSFADYDNDGYLDFYLTNYTYGFLETDYDHLNRLYRNNGDGTFQNTTLTSGVGDSIRATFQGLWFDHNMDGWIDLFVINDRAPFENSFYENNGDGTFTDITDGSGLEFEGGNPMTITIDDINNDGYPDIYNTNVGNGNPTRMFVNNGDGTFTDQSVSMGTSLDVYSLGAVYIDYDNDTYQDLYVATGHPSQFFTQQKSMFYQNINGQYFLENPNPFLGDLKASSFAVAKGDLNNDGYYDIISYNDDGEDPFLWENSGGTNNYVKISLEGTLSNYSAIGSFIQVYANGECYSKFLYSVENYISQNSQHQIFGLGQAEIIDSVVIRFPSGHVDKYYDVSVNERYKFVEQQSTVYTVGLNSDSLNCSNLSFDLSVNSSDSVIWSDGQMGNSIEVNEEGTYFAQIILNNYTVYSDTISLELVDPPVIIADVEHVSCFGLNNGSVDLSLTPSVDTSNYSISWSNGDEGISISNLSAGFHEYHFEDIFGCLDSGLIYIEQPFPIHVLFNIQDEMNGNDGEVDLFIFGGTPPYTIEFDGQLTTPPIVGLSGGIYDVIIQDNSGCELDTVVEVNSLLSLTNNTDENSAFTVYPNPINKNSFNLRTIDTYQNVKIKMIDHLGKVIMQKSYDQLEKGQHYFHAPMLSSGIYTILFSTDSFTFSSRITKL